MRFYRRPACLLTVTSVLLGSCKSTGSGSSAKSDGLPTVKTQGELWPNDVSILIPMFSDTYAKGRHIPAVRATFQPALINSSDTPDPKTIAPGLPAAGLDGQPFLPAWAAAGLGQSFFDDQIKRQTGASEVGDAIIGCGAGTTALEDTSRCIDIKTVFGKPHVAVAMRIDPCFNFVEVAGDFGRCIPQLRVVWQQLGSTQGSMELLGDNSMHGVYRITAQDLSEIVKTLISVKNAAGIDYSKLPVGPHPAMLAQGPTGPYYQAVKGIIHRYARASRLMGVAGATVINRNGDITWSLGLIQPSGDGAAPQEQVAYVKIPGGQTRFTQHFSTPALAANQPSAPAGANPAVLPLPRSLTTGKQDAALVATHAAIALDPRRTDILNLDCGTCHRNDLVLKGVGNPKLDASVAYTSKRWDLTNTITGMSSYGVNRMFSYFEGSPIVKNRVAYESALVTDFINAHYAEGPGSDDARAALATPPAAKASDMDPATPAAMYFRYAKITTKSDGSYQATINTPFNSPVVSGTWKVAGDNITLTENGTNISETYPGTPPVDLSPYLGKTYSTTVHEEGFTLTYQSLNLQTNGTFTGTDGESGGKASGTYTQVMHINTSDPDHQGPFIDSAILFSDGKGEQTMPVEGEGAKGFILFDGNVEEPVHYGL